MIRMFPHPRRQVALLVVIAATIISGCGDRSGDQSDNKGPETPLPPNVPVAIDSLPPPEIVAKNLVAIMLAIEPDEIQIVSSQALEFSDGSLDCPEPGMSYAQVITPGHHLVVEADGRRFDVRVAGRAGKICHRRKTEPTSPDTARR